MRIALGSALLRAAETRKNLNQASGPRATRRLWRRIGQLHDDKLAGCCARATDKMRLAPTARVRLASVASRAGERPAAGSSRIDYARCDEREAAAEAHRIFKVCRVKQMPFQISHQNLSFA